MKNTLSKSILGLGFSLIFFMSCAEMDLSDFQLNDNVEYRMFNLLDDYPSLYEAVNSLDQTTFNRLLGDAVNHKKDEFIAMQQGTIDLLSYKTDPDGEYNPADGSGYHEKDPVHELLERAKSLLERVMEQDDRDFESGATSYMADIYNFIDDVRRADLGYEADIVSILSKGAGCRLDYEYANPGYMLASTEESILDMIDPATRVAAEHHQKNTAKQLLFSNKNLTLDVSGNIAPNGDGIVDTGLGNSVQGTRALLMGVIELLRNSDVRESIYDVIRELGNVTAAKVTTAGGEKAMKQILREEIENTEDFFTVGGAVYGDGSTDTLYSRRNADEYADSELRNVKKELQPHMISQLLRSDRPGAMFAGNGTTEYFLEHFVNSLQNLNIDWDKAHLEESLYDMLRFDTYGRDRRSSENHPVIGHPSYAESMLEAVMSTGGVTTNMGWFDGGTTNEQTYTPNVDHGHGAPAYNITLNDSVFALQTSADSLTGSTMYDLILVGDIFDPSSTHYRRTFRSKDPFTSADAATGKCVLAFNQNYCALNFLATHSVGDVGSPTGGNPNKGTSGPNAFVPYNPTGTKDTNTAAFNMNWVARGCWNGEGPYYYADPNAETTEINGKIYHRYLRPNGLTYAYVHKADPSDTSTWVYYYPAEGRDAKDSNIEYTGQMVNTHASFNSNVDLSDGVYVEGLYTENNIRIRIGSSKDVVVSFEGGFWGHTFTQTEIINAINNALGKNPDGENYCKVFNTNYLQILAEGEVITISNSNNPAVGVPVDRFLINGFDQDETRTFPIDCFRLTDDAVVHVQIDNVVNKDVTFPKGSTDGDGNWSPTEAVQYMQAQIGSQYVFGIGNRKILVKNNSNVEGVAKIHLQRVSGDNGVLRFFGYNGDEVLLDTIQRYNRYRDTWHTDYYMFRLNDGKYYTPTDMSSGTATEASFFMIEEIIPESEPKRACASQEEALYRNLQWTLTEKKIMLIVPMYMYVNVLDCITAELGFFQNFECNGFEGLVNARKYRGNRVWAKNGTSGRSIIPGDYRLCIETTPAVSIMGLITIDENKVLETMGHGSSNPAIIPHTFASISRLAFPRSEVKNMSPGAQVYGNAYNNTVTFQNISVGSREFEVSDSDPVWKKRNGLVPLIVTLLSTAWEMSDETHKGILRVLDSQFASLKPLFYFNRRTTGVMPGSWLPRIAGSEANLYDFMRPDSKVSGFNIATDSATGYFGGWAVRNWYQLKNMPTSMTFMIDSDPSTNRNDRTKRVDGLLAALTEYDPNSDRGDNNLPNTRIITKLIKVLDKVSGTSFADTVAVDDNDISTFGTRRKLFYGLEQQMTSHRIIKTGSTLNLTTIDENNYKNLDFPSWMFTNTAFVDANNDGLHDGTFADIRPEDIVVDEGLNLSIGSDTLGFGLAVFPDVRDPSYMGADKRSWDIFNAAADMAAEMTSSQGPSSGKYNITENLISLIDKFFTKVDVTQTEVDALIHTLGILNTEYNGSEWIYPKELVEIKTRIAPTMADIGKSHVVESAEFNYAIMVEGGLIDYVLNTMETPYSTGELFSDLRRFLNHRLIARDEDSRNTILWSDLIEMQEGLIESLLNAKTMVEFTESNDFQYNGPYGESIFSTWDPFGDLGQVFSH